MLPTLFGAALLLATTTIPFAPPTIHQMIEDAALAYNVPAYQMRDTLTCESGLNPKAVGDHGHSYGLAQIYLPAHKDITKKQALDPKFAIDYMASQFSTGNAHLWTCARMLGYD